jgi:mannan endo-1,4-beta-mannosidase
VTICCALAPLSARADAAEPANPNASAGARKVLNYFASLSTRTNKHIVSGQFSDFGNRASVRLMDQIHEKTGHWPAMIGVDYADFGRGSLTYDAANKAALEYWKQGGLVTVSAHLYNPANPKGGGLRDKGVEMEELLKPDTETHQRWMQELDLMAAGLNQLYSFSKASRPTFPRPASSRAGTANGAWPPISTQKSCLTRPR